MAEVVGMLGRNGVLASLKGLTAATIVVGSVAGAGAPAAAAMPASCVQGMVTLMQQTTMDLDSTLRLHQAELADLSTTFGDRDGAAALLSAADANLRNVQLAALDAVVYAVNTYEPPLTAPAPLPAPTLSYTAAGSTTWSVYAPANAVDRDDATKWSSTRPVQGNWLVVDLGGAFQIDRFRMLQAMHPDWKASAFAVQSGDSWTGPWTDRYTTASAATDSGVVAFASGPATARYWRLMANTGGGNGWEVHTFELFARAIVVDPYVDEATCLDGLALQLSELVSGASAGMDAVAADLRLALASLPVQEEAPAPPIITPGRPEACMNSRWKDFPLGFKAQGDCVSWVATAGRNLPNRVETHAK